MFRVENVKKGEVCVLSLQEVCEKYKGKVYRPLLASSLLRSVVVRDEVTGARLFITRMEEYEEEEEASHSDGRRPDSGAGSRKVRV